MPRSVSATMAVIVMRSAPPENQAAS
jgi:hypothetical protein